MKQFKYLPTIVILFFGWWLAALLMDNSVLPDPVTVFKAFYNLKDKIWTHLLISSFRVSTGVGFALFFGVIIGLILGRNSYLDKIFAPLIYIIYPIPKIAFLPVVLLFLGLGNLSKIFLISIIVFFQVVVTARDAARGIDEELILSVRSLGANRWQMFWQVIFPGTLPRILTATRISIGTAMAVLFLTETFATFQGLGYFIMDAWTRINYVEMYAGIIALSLLGLFLFGAVDLVEHIVCPWLYLDGEE